MAQTPRCVTAGFCIVHVGQAPVSTPFGTRILPGLMKPGVLTVHCFATSALPNYPLRLNSSRATGRKRSFCAAVNSETNGGIGPVSATPASATAA